MKERGIGAEQLLEKIKLVDGAGSGIDSDFLDGLDSTDFASSSHTHASTDITDFQTAVEGIVDKTYIDGLEVDAGTLDGYDSADFAPVSHTHSSTDITDFQTSVEGIVDKTYIDGLEVDAGTLDGYDSADFASSSHTHNVEDLSTIETETNQILQPNGAGGLEWNDELTISNINLTTNDFGSYSTAESTNNIGNAYKGFFHYNNFWATKKIQFISFGSDAYLYEDSQKLSSVAGVVNSNPSKISFNSLQNVYEDLSYWVIVEESTDTQSWISVRSKSACVETLAYSINYGAYSQYDFILRSQTAAYGVSDYVDGYYTRGAWALIGTTQDANKLKMVKFNATSVFSAIDVDITDKNNKFSVVTSGGVVCLMYQRTSDSVYCVSTWDTAATTLAFAGTPVGWVDSLENTYYVQDNGNIYKIESGNLNNSPILLQSGVTDLGYQCSMSIFRNELWIANAYGIWMLNLTTNVITRYKTISNKYTTIYAHSDGVVYFSEQAGTSYLYDKYVFSIGHSGLLSDIFAYKDHTHTDYASLTKDNTFYGTQTIKEDVIVTDKLNTLNRELYNSVGFVSIDWAACELKTTDAYETKATLEWIDCKLNDSNFPSIESLNWNSRTFTSPLNTYAGGWNSVAFNSMWAKDSFIITSNSEGDDAQTYAYYSMDIDNVQFYASADDGVDYFGYGWGFDNAGAYEFYNDNGTVFNVNSSRNVKFSNTPKAYIGINTSYNTDYTGVKDTIRYGARNGGTGSWTGYVTNAAFSANRTYTLPNADGTFVLYNSDNQILQANGTVSLPSYSFASDANTGFYSIGADNIGLSLGGVLRINYKDSIIGVSNHEGSAPSANTGLMKIGMGGLASDVNYAGNYGYYLKNHNSAGYTEYNVTNDSPVNARFGLGGSTAAAGYAGNAYIYSASNIKLQFAMNGNINAYTDTNGIGAETGKALYIGDESTDGSWKFVDSGGTLKIQKRVSGSWVDKGAFV